MAHILSIPTLHRRGFLAAAGGLVVAVALPVSGRRALADTGAAFAPNAFIRIDREGTVTLIMPSAEMGQGVHMAQATLLAEELDIGLDRVRIEESPPDDVLYGNSLIGTQMTGGSTSTMAFWKPLRQAGAVTRGLLVEAAAQAWQVDAAACRVEDGAVIDPTGSKRLGYGDLVEAAAALPVPAADSVTLKDPKDFKLIGKSLMRIDTPGKTNGTALYGIDVQIPGMKFAAIAISPVLGGKPKSVDEKAVMAVKGVRQVVVTDESVAVVADHTGAAKKGLSVAAITWEDGANAGVSTAEILRLLDEESQKPGAVARDEGGFDAALAGAAQRLEAVYHAPFLAHATMEPMNCTVHLRKDACEVWVGTQVPTAAQAVAAAITGLPLEAVTIHNHLIGGGFGRRLEPDGIAHAVKVALQVEGPVKVIWSREEDIQHDYYRPAYLDRFTAGLDAAGKPVAWSHRVTGSSLLSRVAPDVVKQMGGVDADGVEGAAHPPYALPAIHVEFKQAEPPGVLTSWWRGVGPTHNIFVVESFMDELAAAAKADPVAYRKDLLADNPRALGVLTLAAERAGWGAAMPERQGRGVALQSVFGSFAAMVAEVAVAADGTVSVQRLVCAVDCGVNVNPDTINAQVEGGALFGLTAALYGNVTFKDGRVEQSNFDDYLPIRIDEAPVVEVHIVPSTEDPGGIGEVATAVVSAAVTNAVFAATGVRLRSLPIDTGALKAG